MLSLLLLSAAAATAVQGEQVVIHNADAFIDFGKKVNEGNNYDGTTVVLDADIDFSGKTLVPIGTQDKDFRGFFDGQGHAIKNLKIEDTTSEYVGIFGRVDGATIQNLIIDSSCSITSNNNVRARNVVGGLVGGVSDAGRLAYIKNVVNFAPVTFSGPRKYYSAIVGGLVGTFNAGGRSQIINCVNYGAVTNAGEIDNVEIGGLVGSIFGKVTYRPAIVNSANYGAVEIKANSVKSYFNIGGLVGNFREADIVNCVSYGKIASEVVPPYKSQYGSIAGSTHLADVYHSFWSEQIAYDVSDDIPPERVIESCNFDEETLELNDTVTVQGYTGTSLIDALNAYARYYTLREYNEWLANKGQHKVTFALNDAYTFATTASAILPPHFLSEGKNWFNAWFLDDRYTMPLKEEIMADVTLYGKYAENTMKYTISFDADGAVPAPKDIVEVYGTVVQLPDEPIKGTSFTVDHWETSYGDEVEWAFTIPAHDVKLHPVWVRNRITSVQDFIEFAQNVSNGVDFKGQTIILGNDIDFIATPFEPIGKNGDGGNFRGTFDGKGHTIKNLKINTYVDDVGLFGYTAGMVIKNLVIDESCSFESANATHDIYLGSLIGRCEGFCQIENCENRAALTYTFANEKSNVYMGGLAGSIGAHSYIDKCVNRGNLRHTSDTYTSRMGGIVGMAHGYFIYVENSDNYGTIMHRGVTSFDADLSGIVGLPSGDIHVVNCHDYGKLDSSAYGLAVSTFFLFILALFF